MRCLGLNVTSTVGWTSDDLIVVLGGDTIAQLGMISRVGFPVLRVATPAVIDVNGGELLTLVGEDLGGAQEHVLSVTIGGRTCSDPVLQSSSTITCTSPSGVGSP